MISAVSKGAGGGGNGSKSSDGGGSQSQSQSQSQRRSLLRTTILRSPIFLLILLSSFGFYMINNSSNLLQPITKTTSLLSLSSLSMPSITQQQQAISANFNYSYDDNEQQATATTTADADADADECDEEDEDDDTRPWLIVHIGPSKTGTTTIQEGFKDIAKFMAKEDHFYFMGAKLSRELEMILNKNKNNTDNQKHNTDYDNKVLMFTMKDFIYQPSKEFQQAIRENLKQNHNVILSSEFYTAALINDNQYWLRLYKEIFLVKQKKMKQPRRLQQQQRQRKLNDYNETLSSTVGTDTGTGTTPTTTVLTTMEAAGENKDTTNLYDSFSFRVKIVVTYRHFFQWLPSYYHQYYSFSQILGSKYIDTYTPGIVDYIEWYINSNDDDNDIGNNFQQYEYHNNNNSNNKLPLNYTNYLVSPVGLGTEGFGSHRRQVHGSIYAYLIWSSQPSLQGHIDIFDLHQQELIQEEKNDTTASASTSTNQTVVIKNKQQEHNMFADFVCQNIPAKTTCQYLIENTKNQIKRKSGHDDNILLDQDVYRIIKEAIKRKLLIPPPSLNNDSFRSMIPVSKFIQKWFIEKVKQQRNEVNNNNDQSSSRKFNINSYMICLNGKTKQKLKEVSWNFLLQQILLIKEKSQQQQKHQSHSQPQTPSSNLILSSRFKFPTTTTTSHLDDIVHDGLLLPSWLLPIKIGHDKSFDEYVNNNVQQQQHQQHHDGGSDGVNGSSTDTTTTTSSKFCQVNVTAILQNKEFVHHVFFS